MSEKGGKSELNFMKILPFLALAGMGLGLSLFAIDPKKVRERLRGEYKATFDNLLTNSNELEEVNLAIENLPEGGEPGVAQWINDSMEANRRKIAKGRVKPHHVMYSVLMAALSVAGRTK